MNTNMMELNMNEMERINGGIEWGKILKEAAWGAGIGAGCGAAAGAFFGPVGLAIGAGIGAVVVGAANTVEAVIAYS